MANKNRTINIIGANIGLGSGTKGASLGPDAIRIAGLHQSLDRLGFKYKDSGNLPCLEEPYPVKDFPQGHIRYLDEIQNFLAELKSRVIKAYESDEMPLILGGDHCIAIATLAASLEHGKSRSKKPGLLWFDAHADLNTDSTSPSGNIHGMPLAAALGHGHPGLLELFDRNYLSPDRCAIIGVRSVDEEEARVIEETGVRVYTMKEIDERGALSCYQEALEIVSPQGEPVHLSFDIDGVDERFVPGTGTPVAGGLTLREAHLLLEMLAEKAVLCAMDMVEVNPLLDNKNQTAEVSLHLIESALGKRIY